TIAAVGRTDLGRSGIGVGIRAGAARPDIHSAETLKETLLKAKSLTWAQDGASRTYIDRMLTRFGIADEINRKTILEQGSTRATADVADGKAEIVITLVSEIVPVRGIELLGPLPAELQNYVTMTAGIGSRAINPVAAKALIHFLAGPAATAVYKSKG